MTPFHSLMHTIRRSLGHRARSHRRAGQTRRAPPPHLESLEDRWLLNYSFRLLSTLGGADSLAQAVNGVNIVGQADVDATDQHAVLWSTRSRAATDLGTLGGPDSAALGVNAAGTVVGWSNDSSDPTQTVAFIWDRADGMQSLGMDGIATGINDAGQVVGQTANGQAFVMDGQEPILLPGPAGRSRASAINNAGVVAGWDEIDLRGRGLGHYRAGDAWIWDGNTQTDLGVLPFPGPFPGLPQHSEAYALNDAGQVVGRSGIFVYKGHHEGWLVSHAFLWQADQGMTDLGTLGDGDNTVAYAINNVGDVVGTSGGRAFLYHDGTMIDLNQFSPLVGPNDDLVAATGINDAGQIVGYATVGGATEAFVLNPTIIVPPPVEFVSVSATAVSSPVPAHLVPRKKEPPQLLPPDSVAAETDVSPIMVQSVSVVRRVKRLHLTHRSGIAADADLGAVEEIAGIAAIDDVSLTPLGPWLSPHFRLRPPSRDVSS